ncbi:patatin-like phospholipase family protein [Cellulomonas sp. NTE-D12]|uniref:patatin-like phospholipase family protein n=1 Tax=Cellulomonas sp. NTE-D12 TaxID=2962632 RepID=UPI0030814E62|nr:patatin [Cellulomonas sp. NTE-D12]
MNAPSSSSSSSPRPSAAGRALVVAGGGAAGNAWAIGVIAGLADAGVDVTVADLIVGTSSGATVAAQITGGPRPAELYSAIVEEPPLPDAHARTGTVPGNGAGAGNGPRNSAGHGPARGVSGAGYLAWSDEVIASAADAADMRRRMGAAALERDASDGAAGARWRDVVAGRLPGTDWPQQRVVLVAVDARTGEPVGLDRDSGVDLVDAVAASTSAMVPYPIGERRYLNGGYRRSENADLAAGYGRVLVLSPFGGRSRMPAAWRMDLASQVEELRAGGSEVETVFPDAGAGDVFDANALDPSTRLQAARGGHDQGRRLADRLRTFWV